MLFMSDRNGLVEGTIPGLARIAVVTLQECQEAIGVLLAPDPHSRTKDFEGRRVKEIEGGWVVLNHEKYKEKLGMDAQANRERVARCRSKKKQPNRATDCNGDTHKCNGVMLQNTKCNDLDLDPRSDTLDLKRDLSLKKDLATDTGKSQPEAAPKSDYTKLVDFYFDEFEKHRNSKPVFTAREGKAVRELLAKLDDNLQRACTAITNAFTDPWWKSRVTILAISNDPDKFLSLKPGSGGRKYPPPQHNDESNRFVPNRLRLPDEES